ncbi:MAG: HipA domain-containing protein, partial [Chloroflexi bacterium]|nr:HipA domain-containing protein [Chloroflexota bacterium]
CGETWIAAGLPGVFWDMAPDRWGRTLLERREVRIAAQEARTARTLHDLDFLLGVDDRSRMGGLRLSTAVGGPYLAIGPDGTPPMTALRSLAHAAHEHERTGAVDDTVVAALIAPGSSLGGARPKASFLTPDGELWMAKFPSRNDRVDVGAWQEVLARLARSAGIQMPGSSLLRLGGPHHVFTTRRFDRSGGKRRAYVSAMTLTGHRDGDAASYLEVAQAIAARVSPAAIDADLEQLFRRLMFNVMVSNRDDHLRNHGFLRERGGWRLSPAFDINPNPEQFEHSLALDDRATAPDLAVAVSTHPFYRLSEYRAEAIAAEIRRSVTEWRSVARSVAIGATEIALMAPAFALAG